MEGSSFDPDRKAKEDLAKSNALQQELQLQKEAEKSNAKSYAPVRTPSHEREKEEKDKPSEADHTNAEYANIFLILCKWMFFPPHMSCIDANQDD